jgi:hypothetical protein
VPKAVNASKVLITPKTAKTPKGFAHLDTEVKTSITKGLTEQNLVYRKRP